MATPLTDRNLLFGILALQMDFITRDQLVAGMNAWVLDKLKPLGEILVEQRVLETRDRDIIDAMVGRQVERHGGDVEKSLAALPGAEGLRSRLAPTDDQDVQDSLAAVPGFARFAHASTQDAGTTGGEETASWDGDVFTLTSRLRVLRRHARGGLGEVFLARDEALGRSVALKQMQDAPARSAQMRARFLLEAEITGGLDHPFIVPIHGLGFDRDHRPFYAMKFIEGQTLRDAVLDFHRNLKHPRAAGEQLVAFRELLTRFVQVCQAIHYAHERGVLHRDLTPSNIMLGKHGETLVVDWGLAKVIGRDDTTGEGEPTLQPSSGSDVPGNGNRGDGRNARVHVARAGPGPRSRPRPAQRRLCAGGGPLSSPCRPPADRPRRLRRPSPPNHDRRDHAPAPGRLTRCHSCQARHPAAARGHLSRRDGTRPGRPVRVG
jgi:serine/threonine-protein kinase